MGLYTSTYFLNSVIWKNYHMQSNWGLWLLGCVKAWEVGVCFLDNMLLSFD